MMLCRFLLIVSVVLAEDAENEIQDSCFEEQVCPSGEEEDIKQYEKTPDGLMTNSSSSDSNYRFNETEIFCIIKSQRLSCLWSTHMLPKDAQYSALYELCMTEYQFNCSSSSKKERVECQGEMYQSNRVMIQINISTSSHLFTVCKTYTNADIEVLDSPRIITALIKSKDLEVKWSQPKTLETENSYCFLYELKINNETFTVPEHNNENLTYTKINIDQASRHNIQIRAKLSNHCAKNKYWSDWSETVVVGPLENPNHLNVYVIVSIVLLLPMILLAFLLVCKLQRLPEKLFPSVPSPPVKIIKFLEKDDFNQVMAPKHADCEHEAEEGPEILQIKETF